MISTHSEVAATGRRFSVVHGGVEVAHAYLYLLRNDKHEKPLGFLEDVEVIEVARGTGVGSSLVREITEFAREHCYKLVATSRNGRPAVHALYRQLGFTDYGREFRIDFD